MSWMAWYPWLPINIPDVQVKVTTILYPLLPLNTLCLFSHRILKRDWNESIQKLFWATNEHFVIEMHFPFVDKYTIKDKVRDSSRLDAKASVNWTRMTNIKDWVQVIFKGIMVIRRGEGDKKRWKVALPILFWAQQECQRSEKQNKASVLSKVFTVQWKKWEQSQIWWWPCLPVLSLDASWHTLRSIIISQNRELEFRLKSWENSAHDHSYSSELRPPPQWRTQWHRGQYFSF